MKEFLSESLSLQQEAANEKTTSDRFYELAKISTELAQLVAKNCITPPELLRELADSSDATTRQNVAANPNTPTEVLLKLGAEFPVQLLGNPILPLLFLENLYTLDQIFDHDTMWRLALDAQTSTEILEKLVHSKYPQIAQSAQLHVNWAGEMTSGWDKAAYEMIQTTVKPSKLISQFGDSFCNRGLISAFLFEKLEQVQQCVFIRLSVAQNPNTPVHLLEQLAQDSDDDDLVRIWSASNPNIPVHLLEQWAQNNDFSIRSGIAKNPNSPVKLLEQLAQDDDKFVRYYTVSNPNIPAKLLEQVILDQLAQKPNKADYGDLDDYRNAEFSYDLSMDVLADNIAGNPNIPLTLLEQLVQDKHIYFSKAVAKNSNTSIPLLEQLAQDKDKYVRREVASNPNTPVQLLEHLAQDKDESVRREVASNPNTPVQLLEHLAQDKDKSIREGVASNLNTPVQLLEHLAQDKDESVRRGVTSNLNTPVQLLEHLAQDKSCGIHHGIVSNPNFPIKLLLELISRYEYAQFSISPTPCLSRIIVLLHSQTPQEVLAENSCSLFWLERYAIAQNSNSPPNILNALAKDANRIVRAAAKANLQNR